MSVLILTPLKVIERMRPGDWPGPCDSRNVLLTGAGTEARHAKLIKDWSSIFGIIEFFERYEDNDYLLARAKLLVREHDVETIVPMAEIDVMRAAWIRAQLNLKGQRPEDSVYFRNKLKMKQRCKDVGIPTADFCGIEEPYDLINFVSKHGYPVVLKPIAGRGAARTTVLMNSDDLAATLAEGVVDQYSTNSILMVERFVFGELYRVDGLYLEKQEGLCVSAKYIGSHLDYIAEGWLASHLLASDNPLKSRLEDFAHDVLSEALPSAAVMAYHVEIFVTPENGLVLGEVGARLGGGSIVEEIELGYQFNLKVEYIRASLNDRYMPPKCELRTIAGQLHISPRESVLISAPDACPYPFVKLFKSRAKAGDNYAAMSHTNDEIVSFVFSSRSEAEAIDHIEELNRWYNNEFRWQPADSKI